MGGLEILVALVICLAALVTLVGHVLRTGLLLTGALLAGALSAVGGPADPPDPAPASAAENESSAASGTAPSAPRPAWVDAAPHLDGAVYRVAVRSGPYTTLPECQRALDEALLRAAREYLDGYLGPEAAARIALDRADARRYVRQPLYQEVVQASFGPMQQLHALAEFDDAARGDFAGRLRAIVAADHLRQVGMGAAALLGMLALAHGACRWKPRHARPGV